ncbi:MAG: hypothetical protein ACWGQW_04540 [bacterium]
MSKKIKIQNGPMSRSVDTDAKTVGELKAQLGERFSITKEHTATVMGAAGASAASDETPLEDGMSLQFARTTGQKG